VTEEDAEGMAPKNAQFYCGGNEGDDYPRIVLIVVSLFTFP
jgi:hypothetical protein